MQRFKYRVRHVIYTQPVGQPLRIVKYFDEKIIVRQSDTDTIYELDTSNSLMFESSAAAQEYWSNHYHDVFIKEYYNDMTSPYEEWYLNDYVKDGIVWLNGQWLLEDDWCSGNLSEKIRDEND